MFSKTKFLKNTGLADPSKLVAQEDIHFEERPFSQNRHIGSTVALDVESSKLLAVLRQEIFTSRDDLQRLDRILQRVCGMAGTLPGSPKDAAPDDDILIELHEPNVIPPNAERGTTKEFEDIEITLIENTRL